MSDPKPIHRDDLPSDLIASIENELGMKVVCAGDMAQLPPEIADALASVNAERERLFVFGLCVDCQRQMESAWQCPECDAKDKGRD